MTNYKRLRKEAKKLYLKINQPWCPLLQESIAFNNAGFRHLIRSGRKPRPKKDQKRRLMLLRLAKNIVTNPNAELGQDNEQHEGRTRFWTITERRDKEKITVVIRQVGNGKKHFFSIYNQKIAR